MPEDTVPENTPQPPDLDLIQRVQAARMMHDADAVPSKMGGIYWIEAKPKAPTQRPTPRAGHFLLLTSVQEVDAVWETVKTATENGLLGYKSKVPTVGPKGHPFERVIYVITYDADDVADRERVGQALHDLGLEPTSYVRRTE